MASITMSAPLNQGGFGTCVGHAFAKALTDGVLGKYGVPINVQDILGAAKLKGDCWEGTHLVPMCDVWNDNSQEDSWFDDTDHKCRYRIKVNYKRLDTVEEAYASPATITSMYAKEKKVYIIWKNRGQEKKY